MATTSTQDSEATIEALPTATLAMTATPVPTPTPEPTPAPAPTPAPTATPTPTQIPGRADLYEDIAVPEHLTYAWWAWDRAGRFGELVFDFTVHNDPGDFSDTHGLYLMVGYGYVGSEASAK